MISKTKNNNQTVLSLVPSRPDLKSHVYNNNGSQSALLRSITAIATADGIVSLAEYDVLSQIVSHSEQPALAAHMVHSYLEKPVDTKTAFAMLGSVVSGNEEMCQSAYDVALPILQLQGDQSKSLAQDLAKVLNIKLTPEELSELEHGATSMSLSTVVTRAKRMLFDKKLFYLTDNCLRLTGDTELVRLVSDYLDGKIEQTDVYTRVSYLNAEISRQLGEFEQRLLDASSIEHTVKKYTETADELFNQVSQRLALVAARIDYEKVFFNDSLEEAIYDAGNEFELEITYRLKSDNWKDAGAWEHIAKSTFAKELERRVNRLVLPYEKQLLLMKEDLRLFQKEMRIVNTSILERQHHTQFANLMPSLRNMTRVLNTTDDIATVTIKGGTIITISGAVAYFFSAATVLPVILPVVPYFGGAMLVAAIFKWFYDSAGRKGTEILHKRKEFEKVLRDKLSEARESYFQQLDKVGEEYLLSANELLKPVMLEAHAAKQLAGLQKKVTQRMLKEAHKTLGIISKQVFSA